MRASFANLPLYLYISELRNLLDCKPSFNLCFISLLEHLVGTMPSNAPLTENDLRQIEHGGGLKEATEKERDAFYNSFSAWVAEQGHTDITELECTVLEDLVAKYFFTMRVTPKVKIVSKKSKDRRLNVNRYKKESYSILKIILFRENLKVMDRIVDQWEIQLGNTSLS